TCEKVEELDRPAATPRPNPQLSPDTACTTPKRSHRIKPVDSGFDIPVEALDGKAVMDPVAAVRLDVGILKEVLKTRMPAGLVTGLVYDVETGLIEVVAPTARAGEE
ncbi:hypothetical protein RM764_46480, partial [Streptomyces sp. DSM 41699]|nr:hypothetical protein [Streptomyces sp. DSM 41699]